MVQTCELRRSRFFKTRLDACFWKAAPEAFRNLQVIQQVIGKQNAYVFAVNPQSSEFAICFSFKLDRNPLMPERVDFIHYPGIYSAALKEP